MKRINEQTTLPDLKEIGFLRELPEKRRLFLVSRLKMRRYLDGTQILKQGTRGGFWGILEHGELLLENPDSQPRTLQPGDHFGSAMLLYDKSSGFTVTAKADTILWVLDRKDWLAPTVIPAATQKAPPQAQANPVPGGGIDPGCRAGDVHFHPRPLPDRPGHNHPSQTLG